MTAARKLLLGLALAAVGGANLLIGMQLGTQETPTAVAAVVQPAPVTKAEEPDPVDEAFTDCLLRGLEAARNTAEPERRVDQDLREINAAHRDWVAVLRCLDGRRAARQHILAGDPERVVIDAAFPDFRYPGDAASGWCFEEVDRRGIRHIRTCKQSQEECQRTRTRRGSWQATRELSSCHEADQTGIYGAPTMVP